MRVVFLHNWSTLGRALGLTLLADASADELWFLGAPRPTADRDPVLTAAGRERGARMSTPADVADPAFIRQLTRFRADLLIVGTFPTRLPVPVLAAARWGAINVHASLLPRYRGAQPEFWALRDGRRVTGLSIHALTGTFDAGPVIARQRVPILPTDTLGTLVRRLDRAAPALLRQVLEEYRDGRRSTGTPQRESDATNAPPVRPEHLQIDWHQPAPLIERLIRAADLVFEAHTTLGARRVVIRRVKRADGQRRLAPGVLARSRHGNRLMVGTGSTPLEIHAAAIGGRRLESADFDALDWRDGDRLGE